MLLGNPSSDQRDLGRVAPVVAPACITGSPRASWTKRPRSSPTACPKWLPAFQPPGAERRLAGADLSGRYLAGFAPRGRTYAQLAGTPFGVDRPRDPQPLAAIRYSGPVAGRIQRDESHDLRMVEIINNHCSRLNEIIENILQLSRRERSRPETLSLGDWSHDFVEEYKQGNDPGRRFVARDRQQCRAGRGRWPIRSNCKQVLWNLVQNALRYGRHARRTGARDGGSAPWRAWRANSGSDRSRPRHCAPKSPRRFSNRSTPPTNTARAWGFTWRDRWPKPIRPRWNTCVLRAAAVAFRLVLTPPARIEPAV